MYQFIETIRLEKGELQNLSWHQDRFESTRRRVLNLKKHPLLLDLIAVPAGMEKGRFKCRVLFGKQVDQILFEPHVSRKINSLKLVYSDQITYPFKSVDRNALDELYSRRDECEDILIVKKGYLTDSYQANLVFWSGSEWHTPDTPLLPGTMRARLLASGMIRERRITPATIWDYEKIALINALNSLEDCPVVPIENVH